MVWTFNNGYYMEQMYTKGTNDATIYLYVVAFSNQCNN